MPKPKLFIASSSESIRIAEAIQSKLDEFVQVTVWNNSTSLSETTINTILDKADKNDYAIFVFNPDDKVYIREKQQYIVRDNVLFELGIFMGKNGINSTFIVLPKNKLDDFHLPSDLLGITVATYNLERDDNNIEAAVTPACAKIRNAIEKLINQKPRFTYLENYVNREEPSLLKRNFNDEISFERAYKLLLYMFKNETFEEFFAFDLAFERWEELLSNEQFQTFNISNEIFDSMKRIFQEKRCKKFRRILVISYEKLKNHCVWKVLQFFEEQEKKWNAQYGDGYLPDDKLVETKIFIFRSDPLYRNTREKIAQIHDFAVFYDKEKISIIEETLTSPINPQKNTEFRMTRISTIQNKAINLKKDFDEFWINSHSISKMFSEIKPKLRQENPNSPAFQAFTKFNNYYPKINQECAIVIEVGYFDSHLLDDADRYLHLEEAFWLLEKIQTECPKIQDNIFVDTFFNDLSSSNICHIIACQDFEFSDEHCCEKMFLDSLNEIESRLFKFPKLTLEKFKLFGMKKTRNSVTEIIKKNIGKGSKIIEINDYHDTLVDLCISTGTEQIFLGYKEADSSKITPKCTALMAQHYYDLYKFAKNERHNIEELWIFDFNRYTEKDAVRMGAQVAFVLYSFPDNFSLKVVNCIYSSDGTGTIHVEQNS